MKAITLYVPKDTFIYKVDPITKLFYILTVILIPIIAPMQFVAYVLIAISLLIILSGGIFKKVLPIISFSAIILVTVVIIQGLFKIDNKTAVLSIGPLTFYKEGLNYAFEICARVLNILFAFSILVLTTKPSDLIESLVRKGLSPKIGYVLNSVLQIIPEMTATMGTITDAQRARGLETEGKLSTRIKAFFPLIGPVVMNSLIATRERAMALEVRGFNSKNKKTFLNEEFKSPYSRVFRICLILITILTIFWRILS
ncbi:energy-coupling factor transporter transmembrane component T [Thermoanaerobacterium saccharolyticum]|uniref:Cobalt transport protein n=1 Tax=Thermoanaerobacterium thermosaccharolyticum (strain ATCC 7956 / DSM 571 / NCIMB 9385 / NCA 3814 / NCTC 13789 / WDCM 00135 / 2032) TaxID=580327 RepID=D9TQH3_THETC|nr:energy-coupling factor transporter transmembrane component T [Thermoanaerobacterium thermosaccharolyticum]ADL69207.1 cobalt transport protein [Thermoanaerobacterium thermosaccharolyticum DSM 571]MBE0069313.1 energy-coupling factor transporter transmembrane protein EcfT [Thermoanaerobacterium thermosaccharolyticum]MBE0229094.1 energy-coupling factor transporter transmembrane protein EcfT [Thermoanaerobacterium thermosaccharolyticum]PHO06327.1 cobalt ABC transporter permease [Thermoanaerobacte